MTEWNPVMGFEELYEVSSSGEVRRTGRAHRSGKGFGGGARIGRVLKPQPCRQYLAVQLWREGKPHMRLVHVLVAEAFIGPRPPGHEVNHDDGRKHHNNAENLEWVTRSENVRHAYRIGLRDPSVEQMVAARRKPRVVIRCGCGCGASFETPDPKGRDRRYLPGHHMRKAA